MTGTKLKTKDKIKNALVIMLETEKLDEISATRLCESAGVNRATFYYHYDSVQDVLTEIELQAETEFTKFLMQSATDANGIPTENFYVMFFEFVSHNVGICKLLVDAPHSSANSFFARAMEAGRSKVISIMSKLYPDCSAAKIDYYYIFVSNGFIGLLKYWLNSGMRESVTEIAAIGEKISYGGVAYLK